MPRLAEHTFKEQSSILKIEELTKVYGDGCDYCSDPHSELQKNICPKCHTVHALRGVSIEVYPGEIVGVVGESGSGKSTLMQCVYFDKEPSSGACYLTPYKDGKENVFLVSEQEKLKIKNLILGMVYQNPYLGLRMNFSSLSNIAERQIAAGNRCVHDMLSRSDELLQEVNISQWRSKEAPQNFSGGMQQRVQIAKALSSNPPILLLDEVTTGLDLSVQAKVLDLIKQIMHEFQISMLVVSHDLGVIRMLAERTYVMLDGKVVETGLTDQILEDPQHPYTQQLVYSLI